MIVARYLLYGGDPLPVLPPAPVRPAFARLPASVLDGYAGAYVFDEPDGSTCRGAGIICS
jgi:hypothetical protein